MIPRSRSFTRTTFFEVIGLLLPIFHEYPVLGLLGIFGVLSVDGKLGTTLRSCILSSRCCSSYKDHPTLPSRVWLT